MANPTFVLIIGIDDYRSLDPSGSSDLYGATSDAKAWWRLCRNHLQIAGSNIRVLNRARAGHPRLNEEQLTNGNPDRADGVTIADATRDEILAGITWLSEQVRLHNGSGLITYSGHGVGLRADQLSEEGSTQALAPAGMTAIALEQLVTAKDYNLAVKASEGVAGSQLTSKQTVQRITNIFDACYDRSQPGSRSLGVLDGVPTPPRVLSRLMLGCQMNQSSYEIQMNGRWRGAFTHSIQTLMERWNTAVDGRTGVRYLQCSYDNLMFRSRQHLDLLGVPQTPTMVSAMARAALVPVLRPGMYLVDGQTAEVPNAPMRREEFSGGNEGIKGTVLRLQATPKGGGAKVTVAVAVIPVTTSTGQYSGDFTAGNEYWYFNTAAIKANAGGFQDPRTLESKVYSVWPTSADAWITEGTGFNQQASWPSSMSWVPVLHAPGGSQNSGNFHITSCWGNIADGDANDQPFAMQLTWRRNNPDKGKVVKLLNFSESGNNILANSATTTGTGTPITITPVHSSIDTTWSAISISVPI